MMFSAARRDRRETYSTFSEPLRLRSLNSASDCEASSINLCCLPDGVLGVIRENYIIPRRFFAFCPKSLARL